MSENPQIRMIKDVNNFLKHLESYGLFFEHIPQTGFTSNLRELNFTGSFHSGVENLLGRKDRIVDNEFHEDDFIELIMEIKAYQFCVRLESLVYDFAKLLRPELLQTNREKQDNVVPDLTLDTIGGLIHRINQLVLNNNGLSGDVLERRRNTREHYKELFFLKFRNSIIHRDYKIMDSILYYDSENTQNLNSNDFRIMSSKLDVLELAIYKKQDTIIEHTTLSLD